MARALSPEGVSILAHADHVEKLFQETDPEERAALEKHVAFFQTQIDADSSGRDEVLGAMAVVVFRALSKDLRS